MCNQPLNQIFFSNIYYILHIFMPIIIRNLLKYIFWNSRFFLLYRFKSCMKSINYFLNKFRLYFRTLLNDGKRLKLERKREREKKRVWKKKKRDVEDNSTFGGYILALPTIWTARTPFRNVATARREENQSC